MYAEPLPSASQGPRRALWEHAWSLHAGNPHNAAVFLCGEIERYKNNPTFLKDAFDVTKELFYNHYPRDDRRQDVFKKLIEHGDGRLQSQIFDHIVKRRIAENDVRFRASERGNMGYQDPALFPLLPDLARHGGLAVGKTAFEWACPLPGDRDFHEREPRADFAVSSRMAKEFFKKNSAAFSDRQNFTRVQNTIDSAVKTLETEADDQKRQDTKRDLFGLIASKAIPSPSRTALLQRLPEMRLGQFLAHARPGDMLPESADRATLLQDSARSILTKPRSSESLNAGDQKNLSRIFDIVIAMPEPDLKLPSDPRRTDPYTGLFVDIFKNIPNHKANLDQLMEKLSHKPEGHGEEPPGYPSLRMIDRINEAFDEAFPRQRSVESLSNPVTAAQDRALEQFFSNPSATKTPFTNPFRYPPAPLSRDEQDRIKDLGKKAFRETPQTPQELMESDERVARMLQASHRAESVVREKIQIPIAKADQWIQKERSTKVPHWQLNADAWNNKNWDSATLTRPGHESVLIENVQQYFHARINNGMVTDCDKHNPFPNHCCPV